MPSLLSTEVRSHVSYKVAFSEEGLTRQGKTELAMTREWVSNFCKYGEEFRELETNSHFHLGSLTSWVTMLGV